MKSPQKIISQVFSDLEKSEIDALIEVGEIQDYPPGYILCYEGEIEHTFYIMLDGMVDITIRMLDGTPRKVSQREPGEYFGEMALIEGKPRSATVTAVNKTRVLEFSEEVFDRLLNQSPTIAITVLRRLTSYLRSSDRAAIADLSRKNVELAKAYGELKAAQAEIVKKERMERELEIAAEVQQSMLPEVFPDIPNWEFAGRNVPARSVGGDLYDVLRIDDDQLVRQLGHRNQAEVVIDWLSHKQAFLAAVFGDERGMFCYARPRVQVFNFAAVEGDFTG
ncbi:MAG: cyclic nucleotide-binding domain-containing protein, partial [Proteobacteria bacterium]|nr:cyclic nucleotide-binding domain-containing protein [Pseudomonadota bacterium]